MKIKTIFFINILLINTYVFGMKEEFSRNRVPSLYDLCLYKLVKQYFKSSDKSKFLSEFPEEIQKKIIGYTPNRVLRRKLEKPLNKNGCHRVNSLAFMPQGRFLAIGESTGDIIIWDLEAGSDILNFKASQCAIHTLEFSPCGSYLASCSSDGVRVWNIDEILKNSITSSPYFFDEIIGDGWPYIRFNPCFEDLMYVYNTRSYTNLKILNWKNEQQQNNHPILLDRNIISHPIAFSPCGKYFCYGYYGDIPKIFIEIWDFKELAVISSISLENSRTMQSFAFSPCGKYLIAGGVKVMNIWNIEKITEPYYVQSFEHNNMVVIEDISFNPEGRYMISLSQHEINIWDLKSKSPNKCIITLRSTEDVKHSFSSSIFSPCGRYLIIGHGLEIIVLDFWFIINRLKNDFPHESHVEKFIKNLLPLKEFIKTLLTPSTKASELEPFLKKPTPSQDEPTTAQSHNSYCNIL